MAGPGIKKAGVELFDSVDQRRLGGHDGDDDADDLAHDHCHCGWCLPVDAMPVYLQTLPALPDQLTDDFAVPGVSVVVICPRCGCSTVMTIEPKPPVPPNRAN
jgi:hypothetical protein